MGLTMIQLESIAFNHDPSGASHDAINLRRNATQWVSVPEWQRGLAVNPEDSPAAYAVAQTAGNTVTIQAAFTCSDPSWTSAEIRAIDNVVYPGIVFVQQPTGCLAWLVYVLLPLLRALVGNVLGEAAARSVPLVNGASGPVLFDLIHTRLDGASVGARTTEWRWQYRRTSEEPWTDIEITRHRIFTLLDLPTAPWQQAPYQQSNTQLPWTEALDYACQWALGARSPVEAGGGVTRGVNNLGPNLVTYDCPGGGSSWYSGGGFDCTAFLERMKGGVGNGYYVNCSDCATFVSTFANALGCDLWQSRMGAGFFHLNPMLGIGSNTWQPCCHGIDGWSDGFGYHEVAWTGACDSNEFVYDACLKVDGDADPTSAPQTPLLPIHMKFGNPGDLLYRDRLTVPADRTNCAPQPASRARRPVS
jgi:hypothetical protein